MSLKAVPYITGSEARVEVSIEDLKQFIFERLKGTGIEKYISSIDVRDSKIVIEFDLKFIGLDYEVKGDKIVFKLKLQNVVG